MLLLLCIPISASLNDLDSAQRELNFMIDQISQEIGSLTKIKDRLSLMNPEKLTTKIKNTEIEEEKYFSIVSINTSKAEELQNLNSFKTLFSKKNEINCDIPLSWMSNSVAPAFTFKPASLSVAKHILFEPFPVCQCSIKQLRFEFYHNDKLVYKSKVIDLQNGYSNDITIDLETEVVFSSFIVDVIQNWGDYFQTCLNRFHIFGPKL